MKKINYIQHLNGVLRKFSKDNQITSSHRSLYLAFFKLWNQRHFPKTIMVKGKQVMSLAKIRSRPTYYILLRELKRWGYVQYYASSSPQIGTLVELFRFDTLPGQKMASFNKHNTKHIINSFKQTCPENEQVVIGYFKSENRSSLEAKKIYNFYESIDWKLNGKNPIINWKACAQNWKIKADEIKNSQRFG